MTVAAGMTVAVGVMAATGVTVEAGAAHAPSRMTVTSKLAARRRREAMDTLTFVGYGSWIYSVLNQLAKCGMTSFAKSSMLSRSLRKKRQMSNCVPTC